MGHAKAGLRRGSGDQTSTARAGAYLDRLTEANGKRVVVDLNADERELLEALLAVGYADTQSGVVRQAIREAAKRRQLR